MKTGRHARTRTALATLRREIAAGRLGQDDMLPGERDLAGRLGVSRTSLRRMLADLVGEGLLRHRQGVGTFVLRSGDAEPPAGTGAPQPPRLPGFAQAMRLRGLDVITREVSRAVVLPTPEEAMLLACSRDEAVIRLVRLRLDGADRVLALEQAAVPCRYIARPEAIGPSLYESLAACGFPPVRALQRLQAVTLGEAEATQLRVAPGSAGMAVRRTAYLQSGACCEFTRATCPANLFDDLTESFAPASVDTDAVAGPQA